ncbi:GYD domain-containing protein [bacterium]|nr:GYD domain-containing protein [bacterium]MBU1073918.1 GYD domain-containing protein [bacterium]MBU1675520.1 GYD domain-containing protein [bacterium]
MAKYVCLLVFTDTGIKNLRKTTARAEAFSEKIKSHGINILHTLWTVGRYDLVHIFEAESDEAAATFAYTLSALGNVRTNTMRAFDIDEMKVLVENVQTPFDLLREGS